MNRDEWLKRTYGAGFFGLDEVMRSNFCLSVQVARQCGLFGPINTESFTEQDSITAYVQAFVTLPPQDEQNYQKTAGFIEEEDTEDGMLQTSSMFTAINVNIAEEKIARFEKAMKELALVPFYNEWQIFWVDRRFLKGLPKGQDRGASIRRRLAKEELGTWPKLTNVVETKCDIEAVY